ncbi:MAG: hypothetical protein IT326_03295 [Anaerolineae bacterium]|nr:hypothetical protein [Anaerolineae bacterium]
MPLPETTDTPQRPGTDMAIAVALGLFLFAAYLLTTSLRLVSIDELALFAVIRSIASRGAFDANILYWTQVPMGIGALVTHGIDGQVYSQKDIAPGLLALPLIRGAYVLGWSPIRAAFLVTPVLTALTGALLYRLARFLGYAVRVAFAGALTFGLGSLAWPYAETFFTQPAAGLGLLIALGGVLWARQDRHPFPALLGGVGLGFAGLSTIPVWVTLPIYPLYLLLDIRRPGHCPSIIRSIVAFAAGAAPFALAQAAYNAFRFGSPLATGYQQIGAANISLAYLGNGLFGNLLSAPRGLLWYAPFTLLIPLGLVVLLRRDRPLLLLAGGQVLLVYLLYSAYSTWWAGQSWGPRYMVPLMPALVLLTLPVLAAMFRAGTSAAARTLTAGVLIASALIQAAASLLDTISTELTIQNALAAITPPDAFFVPAPVLFDPVQLPAVRLWGLLEQGRWDNLWIMSGNVDSLLLVSQIALLSIALIWLVLSLRASRHRALRPGMAAQAVLSVAVMGLMLSRYPDHPNGYLARMGDQAEPEALAAVAAYIQTEALPGDAIITLLPYSTVGWMDAYHSALPDAGFIPESPLSPESEAFIRQLAGEHTRLWLVSEGLTTGDPANELEEWLAWHGYAGTEDWIDGYRVASYTFPTATGELRQLDEVVFADEITLSASRVGHTEHWLNISLIWQAERPLSTNYMVFVQLLGPDGVLVAQHDGYPAAGYAPTTTWQAGQPVVDQRHLLLPENPSAGTYTLIAGLYDSASGVRLPLPDGSDYATLEQFILP